ncbi:MAG: sulfatase family protein [Planctomycetota bacterium]|jgi:arylsulfatase A-like enzyme
MRVIYFDIDCLRPDHLGCYGYARPTSPNIDRIAAEGVRFGSCYCASSPCLPSRAAWSSGRFGIRNGVVSNHSAGARFNLRTKTYGGPHPDNEMFTRQLRRGGYDTISFSNFADRHNAWWFQCGFSEFHTPNLKGGGETAEEVNEPLLRWLANNAGREDYFLHVNYWDAHRCYRMDASWADRFADSPVPGSWPDEETIAAHQSVPGRFTATNQCFPGGQSPWALMPDGIASRADYEKMVTGYDAAIAYVDHHLGIVLEELDRQGVLEDAAVIISADHGDAFGEHGIYTDHVCADECIQRIPLIVRWPGEASAGTSCDEMLYNLDLGPTVCDLLGVEPAPDWDGSSYRGCLTGMPGPGRDHLVWDCGLYTAQRAVRTGQHLMIRTYDTGEYTHIRPLELYDMREDPFQTRDLSAELPDEVERCEALMREWVVEQRAKPCAPQDPLEAIVEERRRSNG